MMSLTPRFVLPVLPHRNDNDFSNFFSSFKSSRTPNTDTHKNSNYWWQNLTLAVRSKGQCEKNRRPNRKDVLDSFKTLRNSPSFPDASYIKID